MITIIAGCRTCEDAEALVEAVADVPWVITEVVCGCAKGADTLGREWAEANDVPVKEYPANWDKYGKTAGIRRNEAMSKYGEALIALWDGQSSGTGHMIQIALAAGLKVYIRRID